MRRSGKALPFFLLNPDMLPDIWAVTYPAEDRIFDQTESIMTQWRQDYPAAQQVASFHRSMASEAMDTLQEVTELLVRSQPVSTARADSSFVGFLLGSAERLEVLL